MYWPSLLSRLRLLSPVIKITESLTLAFVFSVIWLEVENQKEEQLLVQLDCIQLQLKWEITYWWMSQKDKMFFLVVLQHWNIGKELFSVQCVVNHLMFTH